MQRQGSGRAPGKARLDEGPSYDQRRGAAPGKVTRAATPPPSLPPIPKLVASTTLAASAASAAAKAVAARAAAEAAAAGQAAAAQAAAGKRAGEAGEQPGPQPEPKRRGEAGEQKPPEPKRAGEAGEGEHDASKRSGEAVEAAAGATPAPELNYTELDEAFEKAAISQGALMDHRAIGVREVLGNLNEADEPSLAEELLKTLALAALGYASGGLTTIVAEGLAPAATALTAAIQSGLDDGLKDAATKIAGALAGGGSGASKASFFAGQEDGLVSLNASALRSLSTERRMSKEAIEAAPNAQRETMLQEILAAVRDVDAALARSGERGKQVQYQASLARWLEALAKSELGESSDGGTNLEEEVADHSDMHYYEHGAEGVVYIGFPRLMEPALPLLGAVDVKISGMTEATRQRVADVPLGELKLPVVVRGYICDGFLDSVFFDDNEVSFGRNEGGATWVNGDEDGLAALGKAGHFTDPRDTAEVVLRDEVDPMTLANARI